MFLRIVRNSGWKEKHSSVSGQSFGFSEGLSSAEYVSLPNSRSSEKVFMMPDTRYLDPYLH